MSRPHRTYRSLPRTVVVVVVVVVGLILSACTQSVDGRATDAGPTSGGQPSASSPPSTPRVSVTPATFNDCSQLLSISGVKIAPSLQGKLTAGCARFAVPLDYASPSGPKLNLLMVRIRDRDATARLGTLIVNPGGPGASAVELALGLLAKISPSVLTHFDILGFDPRGVGLSAPISCRSDREKDVQFAASPDVTTAAGFARAKTLARNFAEACDRKYGSTLRYFTTENTARDMDQVRQAVGDQKLNYLGFSYGTELGAAYAHLFPRMVRVAVLDGAVDPLPGFVALNEQQLRGFEDAFDQFAGYCRAHLSCAALGNPRAATTGILGHAEKRPLATRTGRKLTAALAVTGVSEALYSKTEWPTLAAALVAAQRGDGSGLLALADNYNRRAPNGRYANLIDAFTAISCNDTGSRPSDADIRSLAKRWTAKFPLFGKWSVGFLFNCQQWQPRRDVVPKPTAATPTKVLVIGNLHDPATPYRGAKDLAATMGNAELLSWDGEGHTSYLEGSTCIDNYVNNYLISQQLPPENTTCPR
ncbi:MAG: alpha/beta hydrolase [Actinomycetota bacterium]|nr:alpha/beta hydrolase [Actinomycetota bacterium]